MKIKKLINKIKYIVIIFNFLAICLLNISTAETKNLSDTWRISGDTAEIAGYDEFELQTEVIPQIIYIILSLLGVIFMILMVYGGSIWMTAGGKEDRVSKAKDLIQAAVIGLIIVVSAYAISFFVVSKITKGVLVD